MQTLLAGLRLTLATLLVCAAGYTLVIFGVAQVLTAETAQGSLVTRPDGTIAGSRLIAQDFRSPRYFWPRPSAVGYNAAGAGGSNQSPTASALTERAQELIARHGASADRPLPAELAAASGGGLDPHLSERAAFYQAERVATARGLEPSRVEGLVRQHAFQPGGALSGDARLVNVLELNLALDAQ